MTPWSRLPLRTPRQLIAARPTIVTMASAVSVIGAPVSSSAYRAKVTATAATPPALTTRSRPQPQRKATTGWNASRR